MFIHEFSHQIVIASNMLVPGQVLGLYLPIFESCQSKGKGKAPYITLHHTYPLHLLVFETKSKQRQDEDKDNLASSIQAAHLLVLAKAKWFEAQKREGKFIINKEVSSSL